MVEYLKSILDVMINNSSIPNFKENFKKAKKKILKGSLARVIIIFLGLTFSPIFDPDANIIEQKCINTV